MKNLKLYGLGSTLGPWQATARANSYVNRPCTTSGERAMSNMMETVRQNPDKSEFSLPLKANTKN